MALNTIPTPGTVLVGEHYGTVIYALVLDENGSMAYLESDGVAVVDGEDFVGWDAVMADPTSWTLLDENGAINPELPRSASL